MPVPAVGALLKRKGVVSVPSNRHGSTHNRDLVRPEGLSPSSLAATEALMNVTRSLPVMPLRVQLLKRLEESVIPETDAAKVLMTVTWSDLKGCYLPV